MKYHQLLGTAEARMTADEIERTALDTGNLLALAALANNTKQLEEWETAGALLQSLVDLFDYDEQTPTLQARLDDAINYINTQPE